MKRRIAGCLTLTGALCASASYASDRRLTLTAEAGSVRLHDQASGAGAVARIGFDRGGWRLSGGAGVYGFSEPALGTGIAVQYAPCEPCRVRPVGGVEGGILIEEGFGGPWIGLSAGIEADLRENVRLAVLAMRARHGGQAGPDAWLARLTWRLGRKTGGRR